MYAKKSSVLTYANKSVVSVHIAGFVLKIIFYKLFSICKLTIVISICYIYRLNLNLMFLNSN